MLHWISKAIIGFLFIALIGVSILFFTLWSQARREYDTFREKEIATREKLELLKEQRDVRETYLRAFLNDPQFAERVIRERLGYVEPDETLFRFER